MPVDSLDGNDPLVVITDDKSVPIYLQVKHQLRYLISCQQLPEGSRLPPIRTLAERLGVNPGTIALAYRELEAEGFVTARRGRGTVVASTSGDSYGEDFARRQDALTEFLTEALQRADALGFDDGDVQQSLHALQATRTRKPRVGFVAPTQIVADKYAALLERAVEGQASVVPMNLPAVMSGQHRTDLDGIYMVMALASISQKLRDYLAGSSKFPHKVLPVETRLCEDTVTALHEMAAGTSCCLVAERQDLHSSLNIIANYSSLTARIPYAAVSDLAEVKAAVAGAQVVFHTLSATPVVNEVVTGLQQKFELKFEPAPQALLRLTEAITRLGRRRREYVA